MAELVRPWRGVSADERRATRRGLLLESCLTVLGADGVATVTVDRICADAQLTKRYFYESFADLDALLVAAVDDMLAAMRQRMEAAVAGTSDDEERRHALVTILIDVLAEDPRRARLYRESAGHPALRQRRQQAITDFTAFVDSVLPGPSEPDLHARRLLAIRLIVAGTTDLVTGWLAGEVEADRTAIIETIERLGRSA